MGNWRSNEVNSYGAPVRSFPETTSHTLYESRDTRVTPLGARMDDVDHDFFFFSFFLLVPSFRQLVNHAAVLSFHTSELTRRKVLRYLLLHLTLWENWNKNRFVAREKERERMLGRMLISGYQRRNCPIWIWLEYNRARVKIRFLWFLFSSFSSSSSSSWQFTFENCNFRAVTFWIFYSDFHLKNFQEFITHFASAKIHYNVHGVSHYNL